MQIRNLKKYFLLGVFIFLVPTIISSCVETKDEPIKEQNRFLNKEIKSYDDLFNIFWNTVDQYYNYFYEQKRTDGLDWDAVYQKYSPKFKVLKSFGRVTDNDKDIYEDYLLAKQYFTDIVDPILDKNFSVLVVFPVSKKSNDVDEVPFWPGMLNEIEPILEYVPFDKYAYMFSKVDINSGYYDRTNFALYGPLVSNPDIYYMSFAKFVNTDLAELKLRNEYLQLDKTSRNILTEEIINNNELLKNIDDRYREKTKEFTINQLKKWDNFTNSDLVKSFNAEVKKFNETEIISDDFVRLKNLVVDEFYINSFVVDESVYEEIYNDDTSSYINWFRNKLDWYIKKAHYVTFFEDDITKINNSIDFYKNFLNPLKEGKINKMIIDLRSNYDSQNVKDLKFLVERFVTESKVYGYQRYREGVGKFNYTPWIPATSQVSKNGIPKNIPIVVLTDQVTLGVSELAIIMLKSQGNHVVTIGNTTYGAPTTFTRNSDDFNGGTYETIGGRFVFNVPMMAFKDYNGRIYRESGIEPLIKLDNLTQTEKDLMKNSPNTFEDRFLNTAIDYLKTK